MSSSCPTPALLVLVWFLSRLFCLSGFQSDCSYCRFEEYQTVKCRNRQLILSLLIINDDKRQRKFFCQKSGKWTCIWIEAENATFSFRDRGPIFCRTTQAQWRCDVSLGAVTWPKSILEQGQFAASHLHIPDASLLHCCSYSSKNLLSNMNVQDLNRISHLADHSAQIASSGTRDQGRHAWPGEGRTRWWWFVPVVKSCPDLFLKSTVLFFT